MAITCSTLDDAVFYLKFSKGDLQQAVESYFADESSGGETPKALPPPPPPPPPPSPPRPPSYLCFGPPPLAGLLLPPPAYRKHPGDSNREHDRDGARSRFEFAKSFLT